MLERQVEERAGRAFESEIVTVPEHGAAGEGTPGGVQALSARLRVHLRAAGLVVALGTAVRRVGEDLSDTWQRADAVLARDRTRRARLPLPRPKS